MKTWILTTIKIIQLTLTVTAIYLLTMTAEPVISVVFCVLWIAGVAAGFFTGGTFYQFQLDTAVEELRNSRAARAALHDEIDVLKKSLDYARSKIESEVA